MLRVPGHRQPTRSRWKSEALHRRSDVRALSRLAKNFNAPASAYIRRARMLIGWRQKSWSWTWRYGGADLHKPAAGSPADAPLSAGAVRSNPLSSKGARPRRQRDWARGSARLARSECCRCISQAASPARGAT